MDLKEKIQFIKDTENNNSVDKWVFNGVNLWIIIRQKLLFYSDKKVDRVNKKIVVGLIKNIFYSLKVIVQSCLDKKCKVLYVSNPQILEYYNGKYYNKMFHNIIQNEDCALVLEYKKQALYPRAHKHRVVEFLVPSSLIILVIKLFVKKKIFFTQEFVQWREIIQKQLPNDLLKELSNKVFINEIRRVSASYIYWKYLLKRMRVKEIFLVPYYNNNYFGLLKAAHHLNIPTVDVQHGIQGEYHIAYSNFTKLSEQGEAMLPKYFWCWDESSANSINNWASRTNYHQAIVTGHPWVNFLKTTIKPSDSRIILFTAQPFEIERAFSLKVISVLKYLRKYGELVIRLHPMQVKSAKEIDSYLISKGLKLDLNRSQQALPQLLASTLVHVTLCSSVTIEADMFGVKTILLDNVGKLLFNKYIEEGKAFYSESENMLYEILSSQLKLEVSNV